MARRRDRARVMCFVQELALVQGFHVAAGNPISLLALVKLTSLDLSRSKWVPAWNDYLISNSCL